MFKKKKRRCFFYLIVLCSALLFFIHTFFSPLPHMVNYVYSVSAMPVLWSQAYIIAPVKKFFKKRNTVRELELIVDKLRREKEDLTAKNIVLQSEGVYYKQIKELIDFKSRYNFDNALLTKIVFTHIDERSHFFLIDKGASSGIKPGMVAIYKNSVIGKVIQAYPFYAKVMLVTDKSCKVAGMCVTTKASGIHVGNNEIAETKLLRVSHLSSVKIGDLVLSTGEGLVFPQGFALGKINQVQPDGLYYDVSVTPLFDLKHIDYCFIIQKGEHYS